MARRQREHNLSTNIDVTPLVDLTFMLLIVFMVTAPALESRVQLPTMTADEINPQQEKVVTSLDDRGTIYIDRQEVSLEDLPGMLQSLIAENRHFYIRADESRALGEVINLWRVVRKAGTENVQLVTLNE